jgi:hypothetical protein
MKKLRLAGVVGLTLVAAMVPVATADAKQVKAQCPKKWAPTPTQAFPTDASKDQNNNQMVCAKGPQGENGANPHFNVKDDRDEEVNPVLFSSLAIDLTDPLQDVFIVINNLDLVPGFYYLDPIPTGYTDDVEIP